ncbi:MAG: hypothetical protein CSA68_11585 [Rhodobacterales bacterium]|nr:MAG: hypothetical protein CSA68_11585 [Rhodobacterales bacterium]
MTTPQYLPTMPGPGFDDVDTSSGVKMIEARLAEVRRMDPSVPWVKPRIKTLEENLRNARRLRIP